MIRNNERFKLTAHTFCYKEDVTSWINAADVTRMILIIRKQQHCNTIMSSYSVPTTQELKLTQHSKIFVINGLLWVSDEMKRNEFSCLTIRSLSLTFITIFARTFSQCFYYMTDMNHTNVSKYTKTVKLNTMK